MKRDQEWIELELENWARWSLGRATQGHCGSVEHRYRASDWGEDEGPPRKSVVPTDALRALACERAIVMLPRSPHPYAAIVKAHYLRRGSIGSKLVIVPLARSSYKMARRTYYFALSVAHLMVANLIRRGLYHSPGLTAFPAPAPGPTLAQKNACTPLHKSV